MSYKEQMKAKVEAIIAKGHDINHEIVQMVKDDFKQTIDDCKKSGTSLKSATYETLDGIEEGLKASGQKSEEVLKDSANAIVDATKKSSEVTVEKTREAAQKSKDALDNEIAKAKEGIKGVNSSIKDKMRASYADFQEKSETEKEHLQDVADGIKEYSVEKSHHLLSETVDKTKDAINSINTSIKNSSKELLQHSKDSVASWYNTLASKIKKHEKNNMKNKKTQGEENMKNKNNVVAVYNTKEEAESAVKLLTDSGINVKTISVVGKGYHTEEHPMGYYNTGDRVKFWGSEGAFWGGLWGLLVGGLFFTVPGFGPLVAAGPIVSSIVGALEGAVVGGGLSALGAGLYSMGIPKDSVMKYETDVKADKFLLIVHGTQAEVQKVKEILDTQDNGEITLHLND